MPWTGTTTFVLLAPLVEAALAPDAAPAPAEPADATDRLDTREELEAMFRDMTALTPEERADFDTGKAVAAKHNTIWVND